MTIEYSGVRDYRYYPTTGGSHDGAERKWGSVQPKQVNLEWHKISTTQDDEGNIKCLLQEVPMSENPSTLKIYPATRINNAGGYAIGATSMVLDDVSFLNPGDEILIVYDGTNNEEEITIDTKDDGTHTITFAAPGLVTAHLDRTSVICKTSLTEISSIPSGTTYEFMANYSQGWIWFSPSIHALTSHDAFEFWTAYKPIGSFFSMNKGSIEESIFGDGSLGNEIIDSSKYPVGSKREMEGLYQYENLCIDKDAYITQKSGSNFLIEINCRDTFYCDGIIDLVGCGFPGGSSGAINGGVGGDGTSNPCLAGSSGGGGAGGGLSPAGGNGGAGGAGANAVIGDYTWERTAAVSSGGGGSDGDGGAGASATTITTGLRPILFELYPLMGMGGGGGGGGYYLSGPSHGGAGGAGGAGGGGLIIKAKNIILGPNCQINLNGSNGSAGSDGVTTGGGGGGGAGGGGGSILMVYRSYDNYTTGDTNINVAGGAGGAGGSGAGSNFHNGGAGGNGASGYIKKVRV